MIPTPTPQPVLCPRCSREVVMPARLLATACAGCGALVKAPLVEGAVREGRKA